MMSLSFCITIFWVVKRTQNRNLSRYTILDLCLGVMLGSLIGARLFHILYEQPHEYLENPLRIIKVWQGGFVFYGGAIGGFLGGLFVLKIKREKWRLWADLITPIGAFGYGLGRLACFLNGCCYGRICHLPWAVNFPNIQGERHPTQLYATCLEWGIGFLLLFLEKKKNFSQKPGQLFFTWMILHSMARIFMEFFRDDFRGTTPFGLSISTLISLLLLAMGLWGFFTTKTPHFYGRPN